LKYFMLRQVSKGGSAHGCVGDFQEWPAAAPLGNSRERTKTNPRRRLSQRGLMLAKPFCVTLVLLADARAGKNGRHALVGLLRQSVFGRLAGYEDVNDAERLRHDPAMRWIVGGKAVVGRAASPSQIGRFETQWLATDKNLSALADLSGQWIDLVHGRRPPRGIVFDMDSSVSPTRAQENSMWNGHYACTCYHPLFVFNQFGDLEHCALRPRNVHSADGCKDVLDPVVQSYRGKVTRIYFRADAAFAMPEVYEVLEAERIKYAIRLPANQVLQGRIGYLLKRPVGRPPNEVRRFHANFSYQAATWTRVRSCSPP
jgi:hypothetical protein